MIHPHVAVVSEVDVVASEVVFVVLVSAAFDIAGAVELQVSAGTVFVFVVLLPVFVVAV